MLYISVSISSLYLTFLDIRLAVSVISLKSEVFMASIISSIPNSSYTLSAMHIYIITHRYANKEFLSPNLRLSSPELITLNIKLITTMILAIIAARTGINILSPMVGQSLYYSRVHHVLALKLRVCFSIFWEVTLGTQTTQTTSWPFEAIRLEKYLKWPILSSDPNYFLMIFHISSM